LLRHKFMHPNFQPSTYNLQLNISCQKTTKLVG
jgi:hypothetical protein